jgi:hypothetical protein
MDWVSALSRSGLPLTLLSFAVIGYVLISGAAAMVAIWHSDPRRRSSAYKVLELLLAPLRRTDRRRRPGTRADSD